MPSVKEMTARIAAIARDHVDHRLVPDERARLVDEAETIRGDLFELVEEMRSDLSVTRPLPAQSYLDEKMVALCSFTRMALGDEPRGSYGSEKIIENVVHYQHAVDGLIG